MGLNNLIDTNLLKVFGEDTVVPIKGALGTLADDIAPTEKNPAQAAHSVGDFIMYGGVLYKVTAPIAIGDPLNVDTNINKTRLVNEIGSGGGGDIPDATKNTKGKVQIGDNINVEGGVISVPDASNSVKGVVKIGSNIDFEENDKIGVPTATTEKKGVVQVGENIKLESGTISVPDASNSAKGAVQIGENLKVDNGVVSVPYASYTKAGVIKTDTFSSPFTVDDDGFLQCSNATKSDKGLVKIGNNINVDNNGVISVPVADPQASTAKYGLVIAVNTFDGVYPDCVPTIYAVLNEINKFYKYISDTDYKKITHAADKIYWVINSNGQHGVYKNDVLVEGTDVVNT